MDVLNVMEAILIIALNVLNPNFWIILNVLKTAQINTMDK